MERGDYIYCHTTGHMLDGSVFGYAGEEYLVERVSGVVLTLHTECGSGHSWTMGDPMFNEHFSIEGRPINSWEGNVLKHKFV